MPFIFRRIFETYILSILCSLPLEFLFYFNVFPDFMLRNLLISIIGLLVFIYANLFFCSRYLCAIKDMETYFKVNLTTYSSYIVATFVVQYFFKDWIELLIMPTQLFKELGFPAFLSLMLTHAIIATLIVILPRYFWYFDKDTTF